MATGLGALVVSLGLDAADFITGMTRAQVETEKFQRNVTKQFNEAGQAIEGLKGAIGKVAGVLGVGLTLNGLKDMVLDALEATANLEVLGKRAGITGAELSSLAAAARHGHTDLETMAGMSAKLSKALLEFGNDTAKSTVVLKALGFTAEEIPALLAHPTEALLRVSKSFAGMAEDGTKGGAQLLLLGRQGGAVSAAMDDLATQTGLVATKTDEEIHAAREFVERLGDMDARTKAVKSTFALALLPVLEDVFNAFFGAGNGASALQTEIKKLRDDGSIQEWGRNIALVIAFVIDDLKAVLGYLGLVGAAYNVLAKGAKVLGASAVLSDASQYGSEDDVKAATARLVAAQAEGDKAVDEAYKKTKALLERNPLATVDSFQRQFDMRDATDKGVRELPGNRDKNDRLADRENQKAAEAAAKAAAARTKAVQDALRNASNKDGGGGKDDPSTKILEGQLKAIEASIVAEKTMLQTRQEYIDAYYAQGYISVKDYYDRRDEAISEGITFQRDAFEKERGLIEARLKLDRSDKPGEGVITRVQEAELLNRLGEARKKLSAEEAEAAKKAVLNDIQRKVANQAYLDQLDEIRAKTLELAGNTAEATRIRFTAQSRVQLNSLDHTDTPAAREAAAQLRALGDQQELQAKLNDEQKKYSLISDGAAIAQDRINLAQSTGAISEIAALEKTSELNKGLIAQLTVVADAYEQIALASKDPADILKAQRLRLEIEKLGAATDLVADKFNKIFSDAFTNAFDGVIDGTKSVKDAFKDMEKSIVQSINKIASQMIADSLFGKGGAASGAGGFLASLFGTGNDSGGGYGMNDRGTGTSGGGGVGGLIGSFGSWLGGLFGGKFAAGGTPPTGKISLVGENGPELFVPNGAGRVVANDAAFGKVVNITGGINIHVPTGTSRASASQIASAAGVEIARQVRRNT